MGCDGGNAWAHHEIRGAFMEGTDSVITICGSTKKEWTSRKEACAFFLEGIAETEGSEQERYIKIYSALMEGKSVCTDR